MVSCGSHDSTEHMHIAQEIDALLDHEFRRQVVQAAGYTVCGQKGFTRNVECWYALLPGEKNFFDDGEGGQNYLGLFCSESDLLDDISQDILSSWNAEEVSGLTYALSEWREVRITPCRNGGYAIVLHDEREEIHIANHNRPDLANALLLGVSLAATQSRCTGH